EKKALASWVWRNTHFVDAEDGGQDLWGKGFAHESNWTREYWTGLFAFGFGLCGTTHSQWSAEMETLLGHARARTVSVDGHSSFEVFLTGGPYGSGKWVLLDHDISTVIFNPVLRMGRRLSSGAATTTTAAFPARSGTAPGSTSPRKCMAPNTSRPAAPARLATAMPSIPTDPTSRTVTTAKACSTR